MSLEIEKVHRRENITQHLGNSCINISNQNLWSCGHSSSTVKIWIRELSKQWVLFPLQIIAEVFPYDNIESNLKKDRVIIREFCNSEKSQWACIGKLRVFSLLKLFAILDNIVGASKRCFIRPDNRIWKIPDFCFSDWQIIEPMRWWGGKPEIFSNKGSNFASTSWAHTFFC